MQFLHVVSVLKSSNRKLNKYACSTITSNYVYEANKKFLTLLFMKISSAALMLKVQHMPLE